MQRVSEDNNHQKSIGSSPFNHDGKSPGGEMMRKLSISLNSKDDQRATDLLNQIQGTNDDIQANNHTMQLIGILGLEIVKKIKQHNLNK